MWVVSQLTTKGLVRINNCEPPMRDTIELKFAEGMIGVLPVFKEREDAENYADGVDIFEIEEIDSE